MGHHGDISWPRVKFGDMAQNVAKRVDPAETDAETYVGLEHLDSDCLQIRRWGTPDDVIGQKLAFRKGDIIFGRRRAYQRKLAVADFDGICSAHAMVVRAKPKVVLPEFLPLLMQSDLFMNRALQISVGSLSPTINWKTLKTQEFTLPPIDEQKRLAELAWAAEMTARSYDVVRSGLESLADARASNFLGQGWPETGLSEVLLDLQYGSSTRIQERDESTLPMLRIPNVVGGKIDLADLGWVKLNGSDGRKYRLYPGDVLIVRTNGNPDYVGRTAVVMDVPKGCVYASYLIRLRPDTRQLNPTYLHAALSSSLLRRTLRHEIRSSAGNYNLNTKGIKRQIIPLPPMAKQQEFADAFSERQAQIEMISAHVATCGTLKSAILNAALGGNTEGAKSG